MAADARFEVGLTRLVLAVVRGGSVSRMAGALAIALVVVGVWRSARTSIVLGPSTNGTLRIQQVSGITVLFSLVAIFSMFVLTQVIGDRPALVRNIDFARNAREGFFELVAVTALVVAVLLILDWLARTEDGARSAMFDRLATTLIVLTGVVMLSALDRMRLYVDANGLTELRVYTTVFMLWIGFILVWFARTILHNRHARFAFGLLLSGFVMIIGLNVVNPDARITQINADRHSVGQEFDQEYVTGLSVDAVPQLVRALSLDPELDICLVMDHLLLVDGQLSAAWTDHGILGDSFSAWRARTTLAGIDLAPCS